MSKLPEHVRVIFGGTFDPVHFAHLSILNDIKSELQASYLHLVPCFQPVHRHQPGASVEQRLDMLKLATDNKQDYIIDTREIQRQGPSYMLDTLISFRQEYPCDSLCLLIGRDSWLQFTTWHRWQQFSDYAHIIVADRPGCNELEVDSLHLWSKDKLISNPEQLKQSCYGKIWLTRVAYMPNSATQIRQRIMRGESLQGLTPEPVIRYIEQNAIYQGRGEL